jgi:hypothetical protein
MANLSGFDASKVDPKADFEPLPAGSYPVVAVSSEFKPTSKGDGEYLEFQLEVIEGPHRGARLYDRLNLKNPNEKAEKIAAATLSSICRAVGVLTPKDSAELHNRPMLAKVEMEKRDDKPGSFSNRVKNYEALGNSASTYTGGGQQQTKPAQQAAGSDASVPPWKRKSA